MARGGFGNEAERTAINLRQSVSAARSLSFAAGGLQSSLGGAANAAGLIAENIARASRNAKLAAAATGIGAVVAVLTTIIAATISWKEKTKEVADRVREISAETAKLNANANNDKRLATEIEIAETYTKETAEAKKLESFLRKFPALQDAIKAKADAARRAASADIGSTFARMQFDEGAQLRSIVSGLQGSPTERERNRRTIEISDERRRRIGELQGKGFDKEQISERMGRIEELFQAETAQLEDDLATMAQRVGDTFTESLANSIADGIARGIASGNIGEGFKALTGGILVGLGNLMQTIGTESLVAAKLFSSIVTALRSFAPEGAILPSLALIAAGGVLVGIGQSLGGGSSGSGRGNYGGGESSAGGSVINRGLVNPLNGVVTAPGAITPRAAVVFAPTIIGTRDPKAQSDLVDMVVMGLARKGLSLAGT